MVASGQDDVLGSGDLFKERDELKEKCETLERENYEAEKKLGELRPMDELANFLQEEVDWYDSLSTGCLDNKVEGFSY